MALILDGTDGITSSGGTNVLQDDAVITANIANGAVTDAKLASGVATPAGLVMYFAANTAPAGYLKANGAAVSRTTFAALFTAIGTTYGAGDGSTTFALPDLRGEFPRGFDDGRGVDSGRGFGTAQLDQMQRITGLFTAQSGERPSDLATGTGALQKVFVGGANLANGSNTSEGAVAIDFDSGNSPNARTSATTSGETRSRNVALLACIKF